MRGISVKQILKLHEKMVAATGGSDGVRSIDLLESAINNAYATFGGIDLYREIEQKCASVCFSIINNHPFVDGNKRMGIYIMLILLELNGITIKFTQEELITLGLGTAAGSLKQDDILKWIEEHKI